MRQAVQVFKKGADGELDERRGPLGAIFTRKGTSFGASAFRTRGTVKRGPKSAKSDAYVREPRHQTHNRD